MKLKNQTTNHKFKEQSKRSHTSLNLLMEYPITSKYKPPGLMTHTVAIGVKNNNNAQLSGVT